jgi:UDP-GlcNAc:undecaprenyl-phosphate/decaprenyl-phosphate GlcNAc-1-phosphate transferase
VIYYVLIAGIAATVSFSVCFFLVKLSRRYRLYPKIRERDVHVRPTPRLGGIAMFIGVVFAFGVAFLLPKFSIIFSEPEKVAGILLAALIILLVGVADDIWDLDWTTKLAGQIIAAAILPIAGVQIYTLPILGGVTILPPTISLIVTVLAVVLVMNAINFIDGLDGLVAGIAIITNGVFFVYSYILVINAGNTEYYNLASLITAVLIGVCAGFLPLNFHPAKLFMGDAGALLVGLLMATSAITVTGEVDPETWGGRQLLPAFIPILLPFAVLVIPLLDFVLAVLRRLRAGKSPFTADRKHLHHRLLDIGHGQIGAVFIFYGWTTVFALGCLSFMFMSWQWSALLIGIGVLICAFVTFSPLVRRRTSLSDEL